MAADPTPTTVGIIQGDVRLEARALYEEVARVKAAIDELKATDPVVRVEAHAAGALATLEEVQAATEAASGVAEVEVVTTGEGPTSRTATAGRTGDAAAAAGAEDVAAARAAERASTDALRLAEERLWMEREAHAAERATQSIGGGALTISYGAPAPIDYADEGRLVPDGAGSTMASERELGTQGDLVQAFQRSKAAAEEAARVEEEGAKRAEAAARSLAQAERTAGNEAAAVSRAVQAAADEAAKAERATSGGGGGGMSQMALILGLIAALVPMLGPLGGIVVGVAGGFTAMGGAGVLAVLGIIRAMQDGTAVGNTYRAGVEALQTALQGVEDTAAAATLPGFTRAVGEIQAALPGVNSEVGTFGTMLGGTVALAVQTVFNVITALTPALVAGAAAVQSFVLGLDGWATAGDGASRFAGYMVQTMPYVGEVLNHLVTTVGGLIATLSPLGMAMLGVVNVALGLVDVATMMGPAFAPAVAGALALWGAFKGYGMLAPLLTAIATAFGPVNAQTAAYVDLLATEAGVLDAVVIGEEATAEATIALGGAIDFAAGPVGWIVGAIGALAAVLITAAAGASTAAAATTDYTAAVQQDNGVIGENVRQLAAKALADEGVIRQAAALGLSAKTTAAAATGNAAAYAKVTAETKRADDAGRMLTRGAGPMTAALQQNKAAADAVKASIDAQRAKVQDAIKAYNDLQTALGGTTIKTAAQYTAQQNLAAKYGESLPVYLQAVAAQKKQKDQADLTTASLQQENDAAGLLKNALDLLNGKTLGVAQAQTGAAAATNSLLDSMKKNGKEIDGNSAKAVANQQAVQGVIGANQQVAEAIAKATGRSKDGVKAYLESRDAMEKTLAQAGLLTAGVKRYIDKLYDLKNLHVPPTKLDIADQAALDKIKAFQSTVDLLHGTSVSLGVNGTGVPYLNPAKARGGWSGMTAPGLASGGSGFSVRGPGSALSDTAGLFRLANGEEVVSNSNGQADQWRPLLKAINSGSLSGLHLAAPRGTGGQVQKTVNMGGIHFHNPVAVDPVQTAEDASQLITTYAGYPA